MRTHLVGCPDRNCHVRMVWAQVFPNDPEGDRPRCLDLVCLDADERCSGPMCSLVSVATTRMKDRLRRFEDPRPWDRDWAG